MKLLLLNCQSYKTAKKDINSLVDNYNLDFLCLTETWESEKERVNFRQWSIYSKPRKFNNHGGVAILCNQSQNFFTQRITDFENDELEVVCVHVMPGKLQDFLLIVCYIPPGKVHVNLMKKLLELMKKASKKFDNIVCTGDFNAKSNFWGNIRSNTAGQLLKKFIVSSDYICINDFNPTRRKSSSVIDLVITKGQFHKNVTFCKTLSHECVRSDHIPVLLDIQDGVEEASQVEEILEQRDSAQPNYLTHEKYKKYLLLEIEKPKRWRPPPEAMTRAELCSAYVDKLHVLATAAVNKKQLTTCTKEPGDSDVIKPAPTRRCTKEELEDDLYLTSDSEASTTSEQTDCLDEKMDWELEEEITNVQVYGVFN